MAGAHRPGWRPVYRVRQFWRAVRAAWQPLTTVDLAEAQGCLPAGAWPLYLGMARSDQRHGLNVLRTLRRNGYLARQDEDANAAALAQAALLHDCAKHSAGVRLWHRVAVVLLAAFAPGFLARWGRDRAPVHSGTWRYPFWAHLNHPLRGAEMAAEAGCDPLAILLIAHHQDRQPALAVPAAAQGFLIALQAADDDN